MDNRRIAKSFSLKARRYDRHAVVQRRIVDRLCSMIPEPLPTGPWADLGCGTGYFELLCRPKHGISACVDISAQSLDFLSKRGFDFAFPVLADMAHLPLKQNKFGLITVSSALHWVESPDIAVKNAASLLADNGLFVFAGFTENTLALLSRLQKQFGIETLVCYPSASAINNFFIQAGLDIIKSDTFVERETYSTARELLKNISDVGAGIIKGKPLSRKLLAQLCSEYENQCNGEIQADYHVLALIAQKRPL
jgi:malonyl-CoA O-methyltransferase